MTGHPYAVERFASDTMRGRIHAYLEKGHFSAIVSDVFMAVNLPEITPPMILNNENVEYVILRRYLNRERNPAKLIYAWLEYKKMKRWEQEVGNRSVVGMACSEVDQAILKVLCPSLPVVLVPNIYEADTAPMDTNEELATVLFQGGMDWYPNRDGVEFFVKEILPHLRDLTPAVKFLVAGRDPANWLKRFSHVPDVSFVSANDATEMRGVASKATLCVVPLRVGSGTRFKILEAASLAKAIVSTRTGAEGLGFVHGKDIVLVDEPRRFAQAVAALLANPSERTILGTAARARVRKYYSLHALRQSVTQALSVVDKRAQVPRQSAVGV